ncbi:hypothetical protein [Aquimarina sediminis]|uniref:hypothetical protein n=1 Tax=Aquimarina sediminis TaxID=2070536 RepID=UPI000C9FFDB0|nr:hypothetical protein [Aquimarina sediminis]
MKKIGGILLIIFGSIFLVFNLLSIPSSLISLVDTNYNIAYFLGSLSVIFIMLVFGVLMLVLGIRLIRKSK